MTVGTPISGGPKNGEQNTPLVKLLDKLSRISKESFHADFPWLLVLCLPALITPITHGQSVAKVTPQEAGLSSTAL